MAAPEFDGCHGRTVPFTMTGQAVARAGLAGLQLEGSRPVSRVGSYQPAVLDALWSPNPP